MRIAQIAPIIERVPPHLYGGTERVIHTLTEGLVKRGHDVTLFASGDSQTSAELVSVVPKALRRTRGSDPYGHNALTAFNYGLAYRFQDQFDIIHDHTGSISLPAADLSKTPVVITMHGVFSTELQQLYSVLTNPYIVTISHEQFRMAPKIHHAGTIYHGLPFEKYPFGKFHQGYMLYVGRISPEKGVHYAVHAAEELGIPLIIAAKLETSFKEDVEYFEHKIKPKLSKKIIWIGEVDEKKRNDLMSHALCFLHPVTWPEPFGLALIESMACGTPVIAFKQGSIPEVISDKKTGFVVENYQQLVSAIKKISTINRFYCREYALTNFNADKMIDGYEAVYEKILIEKDRISPTQKKNFSYYKNLYRTTSHFLESTLLNRSALSLSKK